MSLGSGLARDPRGARCDEGDVGLEAGQGGQTLHAVRGPVDLVTRELQQHAERLAGVRDGYEVARRVRAEGSSAIRLVALTGYGQVVDRQRAAEAGFDLHLVKPIRVEDLNDVL
jgi:CheY-like chemotaxis protein